MKKLKQMFFNREVIAYLIAGVLTTLVNVVAYFLLRRFFSVDVLLANGIAWVLSVLFAFVANDRYVFVQERRGMAAELVKMSKFFTARLFSFFVDEAGMWLLVSYLGAWELFSKVVMNLIVIILNYMFSKVFIFKSREAENEKNGD